MTMIRDSEGRLSPSEIFSKLACSRRTAELHFRKSTGKSILETINEIRFTTACLLLKQRRWSIAAIAERVGYASTIAFDRFFKSRSGQSPLRWQQKNINSYRTN
jgi:AraC-like DNA-binding protein